MSHDAVISFSSTNLHRQPEWYWVWEGLIAFEAVTLLTAPAKTGKLTLLSLLLDRRREGGTLLGRKVQPGRTIVCSEEPQHLWAARQPPLNFGPYVDFIEPHQYPSTLQGWREFIEQLFKLRSVLELVVIDTAQSFLPVGENQTHLLRKALQELREVSYSPAGVLLLHHPPAVRRGSQARGPLAAFADILLDMQMPPGDPSTRRRYFSVVSRYPGSSPPITAELTPDRTDYLLLPDASPTAPHTPTLDTLRQLLLSHPYPFTRQEILFRWPASSPPPSPETLWRTLTHACHRGLLFRVGAGTKREPFRYGMVGREPAG